MTTQWNRRHRAVLRRAAARALALCVLLTLLPVSALAEWVEESPDTVTVTAFEPLEGAVAEQTVPAGTGLAELTLPDTLSATTQTGDGNPEPVAIEGVTWEPDSPYEGAAGSYTFTAAAAGYICDDGVQWPVIAVTVEEQITPEPDEIDTLCAAIDALPTAEELYEDAPGNADLEFDTWVTDTCARLAEVPALQTQLSALAEDADAMERITEARAEKLAALNDLAERLGEAQTLENNEITTVDALNEAIASSGGTAAAPTAITVSAAGISVDKAITIDGKHVKLTGGTLTRGTDYTGDLIKVKAGGSLTLESIILDGNKSSVTATGSLVSAAGTFGNANLTTVLIIGSDAKLQNNSTTGNGSAVNLSDNGGSINLSMTDGEIIGNTAKTGGAIYEAGWGTTTIHMTGGKVTGNTANGTDTNSTYGGGIYSNGALIIEGGEITGNSVPKGRGGGIYKTGGRDKVFTVTGGTISGNTARADADKGDDVYVNQCAFTLGGAANIPDGLYLKLTDSTFSIASALENSVEIEAIYSYPQVGGLVASGAVSDPGYTITAADLAKFSYKGGAFSFALDTDNNQIKLANPSFPVTFHLTGMEGKTTPLPTSVEKGTDFTIQLIASQGYKLPAASVTVKVGEKTLIANREYQLQNFQSACSIAISKDKITGPVEITAEGVAKSSDATLSSLKFDYKAANGGYTAGYVDIPLTSGVYTYDAVVPAERTSEFVYIDVVKSAGQLATITADWYNVGGITLANGSGTAALTVTAEDGTTNNTYTINFTTAAPSVTDYDVWVGGTRVTSANASDVLSDGKVSYDAGSKTLTLNGASITGTHTEAGIFAENAALAAIALTGDNVIGDTGDTELNCGIMNYNNPASTSSPLSIIGTGKLTVYLKRARSLGVSGVSADAGLTLDGAALEIINKDGKEAIAVQPRTYNGLGADKGLTVKNGAKVTLTDLWEGIIATSGTVAISEDSTVSIMTAGSAINCKTVSIGSATVNVESTDQEANAIVADRIAISDDAHVTAKSTYPALYAISGINITGGTVEAISTNDAGIFTPVSLSISGEQTQVTANGYFAGLQGNGGITITGGTVEATSTNDCGIYSPADITISGGTVNTASTVNCGIFTPANLSISGEQTQVMASGYYPALRGNNGITISGGTIDVVSTNDIGIFSMGTIGITGGSVHAKGGTGWAAIAARTIKSGDAQPPLTITLTSVAEENGCILKASAWFDISLDGGRSETRSWTSFVSADAEELTVTRGAMTNAVNEIRLAPPTVTAVNITPATDIVRKGTTQQFSAVVSGTYLPSRTVTWELVGSHASGTSISNTGLLTVASDETQAILTVKATSTVDTSKSATAIVTISDKEILADAQMTLTMDGWTYGETAHVPRGAVTVSDSGGSYAYLYSADNGATWVNQVDGLPRSTAGFTTAGDYLVKMNYEGDVYTGSKTASFTVAQKAVILGVGILTASKPYDGGTDASLTGSPALLGVLTGDTVTATGGSGTYAAADAGMGIAVAVTGFTLEGADAGNYTTDGMVTGLTGTITQADGKTAPEYADTRDALRKIHIVTNVTPTLEGVTLPAGWAFTGDTAKRLTAKDENEGRQSFPVQYTPADTNYAPVVLTGNDALFPVSTVTLSVNDGLDMKTVETGKELILSGVTLRVTGAALPDTGDYAISNMKWSSSTEAVATVTGTVIGENMTVTVTAVHSGVSMVGVGYQNGDMLGYVLVKVTDSSGETANRVSDIQNIVETLDKLIDPEHPSDIDKAAVDAVADELTKLPETDKQALTVDDVKVLDQLKTQVGQNISTGQLNIIIDKDADMPVPAPDHIAVVGAAIACGVESGNVVVTVKPVQPSGSDTKLELEMEMTVDGVKTPLAAPMFFQLDVPDDIDFAKLTLYHVKDDGSRTKLSFTEGEDRTISFKMLSFSSVQFVVPTGGTSSGTSGGGDGTITYILTATAGEGGQISPNGKVRVSRNHDKTFIITPDEGYEIADVLVDGERVGAVKTYTFEQVRAKHTIMASFQAEDQRIVWNPFTDVRKNDWYYEAVKYVCEHGLMNGMSADTFSPDGRTSRCMIVTILHRLEGSPATSGSVFSDVAAGTYYTDAVSWASRNGIVSGYGNGKFGPNDAITREQLAVILYRYAQYKGYDVTASADLSKFGDTATVGGYATDALHWAVGKELISGKGNGTLDPKGEAVRAQVAAILYRFVITSGT